MKRLICIIVNIFALTLIGGCTDSIRDWVTSGSGDPPPATTPTAPLTPSVSTWDFTEQSNYIFDSNYIEINNGSALLKQVSQTHSGIDFNGGTHAGTFVDGNSAITLQTKNPTATNVINILPNREASLIGYWRMDGDYLDASVNGNNGVPNDNATFTQSSKVGTHALALDGNLDYINCSTSNDLNWGISDGSVSAWIKTKYDYTGSFGVIIIKGAGGSGRKRYVLEISGQAGQENSARFDLDDNTALKAVTGTVALNDNHWHHLVGVRSGNDLKLYIDGLETANGATDITGYGNIDDSAPCIVGASNNGSTVAGQQYFNGLVDEVAIWNSALSLSEVQLLYNSQIINYTDFSSSWTPKQANIVGYWKMDGNWQDSSGNENHGSPMNDATFSAPSPVGSYAGSFDGTADWVTIPNFPEIRGLTKFTISYWFNSDTSSCNNFNRIFSTFQGVEIWCNAGKMQALVENSSVTVFPASDINVTLGQWVHGVLQYDGVCARFFINGAPQATCNLISPPLLSDANLINSNYFGADAAGFKNWNGQIDDFGIWNTSLSEAEIKKIYNRQKQKYAGHYDSPVIDLGTSVSWNTLTSKTTLPFYKELPMSNESPADYSSLTSSLSSGLIGYWPFNETILDNISGNDFEDMSAGTLHLNEVGGITPGAEGILLNAALFDGVDDSLSVPIDLSNTDVVTVSLWMNLTSNAVTGIAFEFTPNLNGSTGGFVFSTLESGGPVVGYASIGLRGNVGYNISGVNVNNLDIGAFQHYVLVYDMGEPASSEIKVYINGKEIIDIFVPGATWRQDNTGNFLNSTLYIGSRGNGQYFLPAKIDDFMIWERALSAPEIEQLYRRGGNRIKYQVKSCVDSSCNCKSLTATGDGNDCDGDGIVNSNDSSDSHFADWLGKGGGMGSSFSELQNCSAINIATGDCDIAAMATINSSFASFDFGLYPVAARPSNNRYFQYRVIMEAEQNLTCSSGTVPCLPELSSIAVGPTGRYFGGAPLITSTNSVAYTKISRVEFSESGCDMTYQLSPDGTNYRYWDGNLWAMATGPNKVESASGDVTKTNITSFADQAGPGTLYWRAFMNSDTSQACNLNKITVSVLN